jgi:hypothetical protein
MFRKPSRSKPAGRPSPVAGIATPALAWSEKQAHAKRCRFAGNNPQRQSQNVGKLCQSMVVRYILARKNNENWRTSN